MADFVDVTVDVPVEIWSPGGQLFSLRNEAVHEVTKEHTGVVGRFLKVETFRLHQHREDVVPLETFRLLHIVAVYILKGEASIDGPETELGSGGLTLAQQTRSHPQSWRFLNDGCSTTSSGRSMSREYSNRAKQA